MKTFAIALVALLVIGGAVPMALAQQDNQSKSPASQPAPPGSSAPSSSSGSDMKSPGASGSVDARGGISADVKTRTDRSDDAAGSASPRTTNGATRTGFFGLSPTAAIIVSVAVLLVVILAIVAMTNNRGTTYIDRDRGL